MLFVCMFVRMYVGIVLFFSMATQFDKAALGTDAVAKEVDVIIGAGEYSATL